MSIMRDPKNYFFKVNLVFLFLPPMLVMVNGMKMSADQGLHMLTLQIIFKRKRIVEMRTTWTLVEAKHILMLDNFEYDAMYDGDDMFKK